MKTDERSVVTHRCPPDGEMVCPCCGVTPFELPSTDQLAVKQNRVTCYGLPRPLPLHVERRN